ncbi:hypothetical protein ACLOJK_007674 [Asimina triloba]
MMRATLQQSASDKKSSDCLKILITAQLGGLEDIVDLDENDYDEYSMRAMEASRAEQWAAEERVSLERDRPIFKESMREVGSGSGGGTKVVTKTGHSHSTIPAHVENPLWEYFNIF